jgi:hypothetical protein
LPPRWPSSIRGAGGWYSNPYKLISRKGVRSIKQKEGTGIKRVNINLEVNLHNAFKAATAAQGVDMTTVLMKYIQDYVAKYGSATPRKSRRA